MTYLEISLIPINHSDMLPGTKFLTVDLIIQRLIGAIYILAGIGALIDREGIIFLLLVQFFLGGWQILSALIVTAIRKNKQRLPYFVAVAIYFSFLIFGGMLMDQQYFARELRKTIMTIGFILIPMSYAIWYHVITTVDYQNSRNSRIGYESQDHTNLEGILDEGIWKK